MASRSKKKTKPRKTQNKKVNKEIKYLKTLLDYTLRAKNGQHGDLDKLFDQQADKIRKQIKDL